MANATPDTVVYVSNAGSKEVHAFAMNRQNGELGVIEKAAVPGTDKPSPTSMPLAVAPDHRFLYAALRSEPYSVASFAIDRETGRLNHLSVVQIEHPRGVQDRRHYRHIVGDRPLPDREDPARLRHRPSGPLSALGRAGFKRDDGSRDRSAIGRAVSS
jgi:hypothetical protein